MPQVASETAAPTVTYARLNPTRSSRASEETPDTPFQRMLDDTTAAADQDPDTPSPTKTASTASAQKTQSSAGTAADKTEKPAKSASDKGQSASKSDKTAQGDKNTDPSQEAAKTTAVAKKTAKVGELAKIGNAIVAAKAGNAVEAAKAGNAVEADNSGAAIEVPNTGKAFEADKAGKTIDVAKAGKATETDKTGKAIESGKDGKDRKDDKDSASDSGSGTTNPAATVAAQPNPVAGIAAIVVPVDTAAAAVNGSEPEAKAVTGSTDSKGGKSAASAQIATLLSGRADASAKTDGDAAAPGNAAAAGKTAGTAPTPDQTGIAAPTDGGPADALLTDKKFTAPAHGKAARNTTGDGGTVQPDATKIGNSGTQPMMQAPQAHQPAATQQAASVAPPSSPTPTPTAAAVPIAGVAVEIAGRALSGKNHFEIRLDPPELGRIEVHLDVSHDGRITTHVVADRSDTLTLLQRDASDLQRTLQDAGLKTGDNGLQFSLRDQTAGQQQQQPSNTGTPLAGDDDKAAAIGISPAALARYAARTGGIDIRV